MRIMNNKRSMARSLARAGLLVALLLALSPDKAEAQFDRDWLSVGSLHNWYSAGGAEIEHGFVSRQQYGLHWPGIYRLRDAQAAKLLWIGARNVQGTAGDSYPIRVVHVGPRVRGVGEVFPTRFETIARYYPTEVIVDGEPSEGTQHGTVDSVDESIAPDRMIVNRMNTLLGITMERRIMQFTTDGYDNFHVIEYTFTNTGMTDETNEVRLNQTLEDVVFFQGWRWSVAAESRYVIGNPTGWGMQTMIDRRGDGLQEDPEGENFRAQFAWHGHYPGFTEYSSVGGPILPQALPAPQIAVEDTLGRLGASHFVGSMTLHADRAPNDPSDDWGQPFTRNYFDSDHRLMSQNSAFDPTRMADEYNQFMTAGIQSPRHAYMVEPTGDPGFINPTGNPAQGTNGGYSAGTGYGPYTLAPGESVTFIKVEAAAGLSRAANESLGRQYLQAGGGRDNAQLTFNVGGVEHSMTKNEWVMTSRDSLMQTFRRAQAAYEAGWELPQPPPPPVSFEALSRGDGIVMSWQAQPGAMDPDSWDLYRARSRFDSTYTLVATLPGSARDYIDDTPTRGIDYYYYLVAVDESPSDPHGLLQPGTALRSSRYHTQMYQPARLLRAAGTDMADIRVVPNPFNIRSDSELRWPDQDDRLGFLNVPGQATIQIFSELGELIDTIHHADGSGDAYWNHTTSAGQVVASGVYIAVVTNEETGERAMRKFVIIR
jgi:hypothetical protein